MFLFALSVVVDDLLDQRTGLQRRKRRCSSTARHLILGIGMSWACARAPRASCTGRGASETGHHVSGCADGHRSSQRLRESAVNTFFLFPAGPGVGPGWVRGWVRGRFLAAPFGIQLAVAATTSGDVHVGEEIFGWPHCLWNPFGVFRSRLLSEYAWRSVCSAKACQGKWQSRPA